MDSEKKLEWQIAITSLCTAIVCVSLAVACVASVFFGWGAV